jgi:2-keto-4-pentenoate hydratase
MDDNSVRAAADLLWEHWQAGRQLGELPVALRPHSRREGYAIQALLEKRSASPLFGWKIAATSAAGQAHIGVDGPIAGRLLRERVSESGATVSTHGNHMRVAEPEFAFRMGRDLPSREPEYSTEEVIQAVESIHPAIEVPDSRYEDFARVGAAQLIADDACAHLFVLGAAARYEWRALDLAEHSVHAGIEGAAPRAGRGSNVLGDPRVALTWLANEISRLGITLKAGQVITTGTCMTPLEVSPGDKVSADFGVLGRISVAFSA